MLQLALYLQQNANPLQGPFTTWFSATPTNKSDSMATGFRPYCHDFRSLHMGHDLGPIAMISGHCIWAISHSDICMFAESLCINQNNQGNIKQSARQHRTIHGFNWYSTSMPNLG
jgi:hypothetical protein